MSSRVLLTLSIASLALFVGCSGDDDDGKVGPDAGARDAGPRDGGNVVVGCDNPALSPPGNGTCAHTPGTNNALLIRGDVIAPGALLENAHVLVGADGRIKCAACDCSSDPDFSGATTLECAEGLISPALINSHDHITFTETPPTPPMNADERYEHRHNWRRGQDGHERIRSVSNMGGGDGVLWGELRQLFAGATSINGSGGADGLLRNLDRNGAQQEGLSQASVEYETFPLGDTGGERRATGCDYPSLDRADSNAIANAIAYSPHIAEGIDDNARNEFLCLSSDQGGGSDVLLPKTAVIHGIGLIASDFAAMAAEGSSLIWSPRSNISLYGHTAQIVLAKRSGVNVALGTDWTATGSINMLRELRCADQFNKANLSGLISDAELVAMATANGAAALGSTARLGSLATGREADITIFNGAGKEGFRGVLDADPDDVVLVLRSGTVLYGDSDIVAALPRGDTGCETIDVCGAQKRACVERETGKTIDTIRSALPDYTYDIFFCGEPPMEPTCVPFRVGEFMGVGMSGDPDGDGVVDAMDNCPNVFNPVRPLDQNVQADVDNDMVGDACDVCPLDADTMTCSTPDPNDLDGDTVPNASDNCPGIANTDQADRDGDMIGDLCDQCPDESNIGGAACTSSIYEVKQRNVTMGRVRLENLLVTGVSEVGYFVQTVEGDERWDATLRESFSGLFVYTANAGDKPARGDRVTIDGEVGDFFGQVQLSDGMFTVLSSMNSLPTPILVTPAEVTTGAARADELEGVLIEVRAVTVTDIMPPPGTADTPPTNEFVVDQTLRVNDYFFLLEPFPIVNEQINFIIGILRYANANTKLEPRDITDVGVPPALARFEPSPAYVRAGNTGVPSGGFSVVLNRPAITAVDVTLGSGMEITIPAMVTIPTDEISAELSVDAPTASPNPIAVTAAYDGAMINGEVIVYDDAAPRLIDAASLESTTIATSASVDGSVTINLPGAVGGTPITFVVTPPALATVAPVTIAQDAFSATFTLTTATATGAGVLTVSTATDTETIAFTVQASVARPPVAGDLIITEVHRNPSVTPDEFRHEWFEVFNTTTDMLEIDGLTVEDNRGMQALTAPGVTIGPNEYVVIAHLLNPADNGGVTAIAAYDTTDILLGNGSDQVVLSIGGAELDRVVWSSGWPGAMQGRSMCLKFPYGDNEMQGSWTDSVGSFGTGGDTGHPGVASDSMNCP